jgi:hypothetical protein
MFTARTTTPREAGAHVAELLGDTSPVQRIWADSDVNGIDVYLLTSPLDPSSERDLLRIGPALRQRCPTVVINLRLINPVRWDASDEDLLRAALPSGAREIARSSS